MMGATSSPKATFPAFSSAPKAAAASSHAPAPTIKKPESSSGMTVKLIHPDEDISLVRAVNTIDRVHVDGNEHVHVHVGEMCGLWW